MIGLVAAVALGIAIYFGGVRINLSRFFRVTGFVLVLVAAGLLATAAHTAHEAGWINGMQGQALDLTWLVQPEPSAARCSQACSASSRSRRRSRSSFTCSTRVPMGLYVDLARALAALQPTAPPAATATTQTEA